jgi:Asp-tRNA(Asn)/Glu-tRNA(Gln) amidotransferase A subunit family amidase
MSEPFRLTAVEAARHLREGRLTATALVESLLDRIAAREPMLHAFAFLDPDAVRQAARAADRASHGGVLHGLPLGVKDVIDAAGMPTGQGSPIWSGHRPRADAAAVALARAAGAVILGKTATTEFAGMHPAATVNPHDPQHTPGGSSAGSAAAVADLVCPFAFGTQTAGSIIRPAAFCGVVGYKPTFGTIHRGGMRVMSESLDTIGALARSVGDCALLVGAASGIELGMPEQRQDRAPRLGLSPGPEPGALAPETLALLDRVAQAAARAGASLRLLALSPELAAAVAAHATVMYGETAQALAWELAVHPDLVSPGLRGRVDRVRSLPPDALPDARAALAAARAAFHRDTLELDAVLTPSAPGEAPRGLGATGNPICNLLWTALHGPCITIPAGSGPSGLPLGVQLVGRPGEDRQLLAWAAWLAAAIS